MRTVAGICALLQLLFAAIEVFRWKLATVERIAPSWVKDVPDASAHVLWARKLAANMGIYNLMLGLGLAWVTFSEEPFASSLSLFFAIWLLVAAAAALATGAIRAFQLQGPMGLALLLLTLLH